MELIECVPNFSEGRDRSKVDTIVSAISSVATIKILDVELDENHNRSVITFVGDVDKVSLAAFEGIKKASEIIDLEKHHGEHPRFGATDVVPFIPLGGVKMDKCIEIATQLGKKVGAELGIPVYMYGEAALSESRRDLSNIRSKSFQYEQLKEAIKRVEWKPDFGPASLSSAGATIIGARDFLIAYNVNLNTGDIEIGKRIAKALRARDGGLTFVKALAFFLKDRNMVQISMNLTNFKKTPIYRAYELVKLEASRYGVTVRESEVVGLLPLEALMETSRFYLQLNEFKLEQILEKKVWE